MMNVSQPCKGCPWMRTTKPGALGGSDPEVYIGQAQGPFVLPCHNACDFDDPEWREKSINTPQCAGAAMYRRSMGISDYLPPTLHSLEPGDYADRLLSDPLEFYMHHKQISRSEAEYQLKMLPPGVLLQLQLHRSSNIHYKIPTREKE